MSDSLPLPTAATDLLGKSDILFISSSHHHSYMGTNNRGGPRGFVRVLHNDSSKTVLVYPEYSGNRLYQTLGNLQTTPQAGLVFPDFDTGDVLYVTGTTEIVVGKEAAILLPRSNLAVKIHVSAARFVRKGLAFRGQAGDFSPYNPPVRYLASEHALPDVQATDGKAVYTKLVKKEMLTPSIARFRFSVSDPVAAGRWNPGQYVALAFEEELGLGYSHMRPDDPRSLNDDLTRTFTVSSAMGGDLPDDEFEITFRNVGKVTDFLFKQSVRSGLEIPLKGFGGDFAVKQNQDEVVPFVAGGIGITPLLPQLDQLKLENMRLVWTIHIADLGLVLDTFKRCAKLARFTSVFISGLGDSPKSGPHSDLLQTLGTSGASTFTRRIDVTDVLSLEKAHLNLSSTWYICTGSGFRKSLLSWLSGKTVIYEDFNY